jgi:RND family efflux transporter MFP subunit
MDTRRAMRAAAILLTAAALAGCSNSPGRRDGAADADVALLAPRDVATVGRADLATGVAVQGVLQPAVDVHIVAPFPEVLDAVLVKEGQAVGRGQVLARFRVTSMAPAAASAEAARRVAAAEHTRMQNLLREGAVSQRDLDAAEAQLRAAEAQAALAQKYLGDATVTAPVAGVIAKRYAQSGDRVADGDPIFRLVDTGELEFEASVPTEALGGVRPGAPVALTVSGLGGVTIAGRVARINATVDQATRQVKIYVTVPNRDHRLAGDMFASGRIVLREVAGAVAVPGAAVQPANGSGLVAWVIRAGKVERRPVTVGLRDERADLVEIKSGLALGETVIVSPMEDLTPGQRVELTGDSAAAVPPAAKSGAVRPAAPTTATPSPAEK